MKLNSNGVFISILILILMILICHTMNYLYPKNRFENIPKTTNYNKIYYTNQNQKISCDNLGKDKEQAEVPCDVIKTCNAEDELDKNTLSDSELAYLYKVAYEAAAREIFMRTLNENEA